MNVRVASPDDVEAIHALEQRLFGQDAWSAASVHEEVALGLVLVAEDGVGVLGYAATRPSGDVLDLTRIGVRPERRRTGVATHLLARALEEAAPDRPVLLEVSAANDGALAFYASAGFAEIDRRRRYYRDGTDAVVMRRTGTMT